MAIFIGLMPGTSMDIDAALVEFEGNKTRLSSVLGQTYSRLPAEDIQATLVSLTCRAIRTAITKYAPSAGELLVCGGGAHNPVLMQELAACLPEVKISPTSEKGLPPSSVEAVAFAWLAKQRTAG